MKIKTLFCLIHLLFSMASRAQSAEPEEKMTLEVLQNRVQILEQELKEKEMKQDNELYNLKNQVTSFAPMGMLLFLFGGVCALWAQSTGRSAWAWFFAGLFLSVLALIVVLATNSNNDINKSDN